MLLSRRRRNALAVVQSRFTVVGEMVTAQEGLGTTIMMAARSFRSTDLYAGIILLGLVGIANSGLLALIERVATPWRAART